MGQLILTRRPGSRTTLTLRDGREVVVVVLVDGWLRPYLKVESPPDDVFVSVSGTDTDTDTGTVTTLALPCGRDAVLRLSGDWYHGHRRIRLGIDAPRDIRVWRDDAGRRYRNTARGIMP